MTTQPFYNTGTAVLTNGSTAMVGTGTNWVGNIRAYDRVVGKDGKEAIVGSVTDNTHIVLLRPWQGTTQATDVYEIWMSPDAIFLQTLTRQIFETLAASALVGIGGLTPAANTVPYFDGTSTAALATLTAFARSILDDADASTVLTTLGVSAFAKTILDDAAATNVLTTLGISTFIKTLLDDADGSTALSTLGVSAYAKTLLDDADASTALSTLGFSAFAKTIIDDADGPAVLTTLGFSTYFKTLVAAASSTALTALLGLRTIATGTITLYVGFNLGTVTIPIASPAVANKTAHGLVAGSRVGFSIQPNKKPATISVATPAVVTMVNTFVAGQPILFETTSALPTGLTPGTTYYVIATGLSGASFQISATVGGAAINTTAPAVTITNASPGVLTEGSAHGLAVGDLVTLATTGALPTGLTAGTQYFVKTVPLTTTYTLSATPEGAAINTSSAGSGTHTRVQAGTHYLSETGVLPTGVTAGQDYFVIATGLTANAFQFSATLGGAAINATGTVNGTIIAKTGSDSNDGLNPTAASAMLTLQAAWNKLALYDLNVQAATIQLAFGQYNAGLSAPSMPIGGSSISIQGDITSIATQSNTFVNTTIGAFIISSPLQCTLNIRGMRVKTTGASIAAILLNAPGTLVTQSMEYMGGTTGFAGQLQTGVEGALIIVSANTIWSGNASAMVSAGPGIIQFFGVTISLLNRPVFSWVVCIGTALSKLSITGVTFAGYAKGARYSAAENSVINTGGGGASYLPGDTAGSVSTGGQYI